MLRVATCCYVLQGFRFSNHRQPGLCLREVAKVWFSRWGPVGCTKRAAPHLSRKVIDLEIQKYGALICNMYRSSMLLFGWISKHHNAWMWMARDCEDTPQKDAYQQWQLVTWQKCSRFVTRSPWWIFSQVFEPKVTCITYLKISFYHLVPQFDSNFVNENIIHSFTMLE